MTTQQARTAGWVLPPVAIYRSRNKASTFGSCANRENLPSYISWAASRNPAHAVRAIHSSALTLGKSSAPSAKADDTKTAEYEVEQRGRVELSVQVKRNTDDVDADPDPP